MATSLICGLVVSCWEHHRASTPVQQITKKLLVLDRLTQPNAVSSDTPGGGAATRKTSDCLATSLKAFVLHESQGISLTEKTREAILALCEECLEDKREDTFSRFSSLAHSEVSPALNVSFSAVSSFLHELQEGPDAVPASSQEQHEHQQEADYETSGSAHWLSTISGLASSASSSEAIDSRRPSTSTSPTQQQGAVGSGSTEAALAFQDDQVPPKVACISATFLDFPSNVERRDSQPQ
ncbi:hypothetical protein Emed_005759 [Eimeria media]